MPQENDAQQSSGEAQQGASGSQQGEQQTQPDPYAELASVAQELNLTPEQIKGRLEASKTWERRAKASDTVSREDYERLESQLNTMKRGNAAKRPQPEPDEGALEAAVTQAREEGAREQRESDYTATAAAMLRVALRAHSVTDEEQLNTIVASTNLAYFKNADGALDDEKVAEYAISRAGTGRGKWPDMGQRKESGNPPIRTGKEIREKYLRR